MNALVWTALATGKQQTLRRDDGEGGLKGSVKKPRFGIPIVVQTKQAKGDGTAIESKSFLHIHPVQRRL